MYKIYKIFVLKTFGLHGITTNISTIIKLCPLENENILKLFKSLDSVFYYTKDYFYQ